MEFHLPILFNKIKQIKTEAIEKGYVQLDKNKKKYFIGLYSSNIRRKPNAVNNIIRWTIKY